MRDYPLADDKYAIEQLASRYSFIDINKVGIYGHSGGGFMAASAILTYPDFYKAAVSCSGNHDNYIYNRGWGECYNGVREIEKTVKDSLGNERKEYEYKFSVKTNAELAKNLKGHLMLVTGDEDKNVNPAHTYRLAHALIESGKDFDMLVIPGAGHGYGSADKYFEKKCIVSLQSICWEMTGRIIGETLTATNRTIDKIYEKLPLQICMSGGCLVGMRLCQRTAEGEL